MIKIISKDYLRIVGLLLCLFVLSFSSCSGLKNVDMNTSATPQRILQIAVKESNFEIFNQSIQDLGLLAVDFRVARISSLADGETEYYMTFRFAGQGSFVSGCSMVMSTGVAHRINYQYQE